MIEIFLLISNQCGMIFVPPHLQLNQFIIENHIVQSGASLNEYPLKNNCSDMKEYPKLFKSGNNIVFIKEPNKQYQICYFSLSPSECEIISD